MSAQHGFDVLADGVRRDILAVLAEHGECSSGEIARHIRRVQPNTISSHLQVLRAAGAVAGRYRYYSLDPADPTRDALTYLRELLGSSCAASSHRRALTLILRPARARRERQAEPRVTRRRRA